MSFCVKKPQLVVPVFGWSKVAMRYVSCRTSFLYHFYDFIFVRLSWLSVQLLFLPTSHCRQCHMPLVRCPRSVKHKYKIENINSNPKIQTTNPKTQIQIQNRKHKWKSQNTNTNPKTQMKDRSTRLQFLFEGAWATNARDAHDGFNMAKDNL